MVRVSFFLLSFTVYAVGLGRHSALSGLGSGVGIVAAGLFLRYLILIAGFRQHCRRRLNMLPSRWPRWLVIPIALLMVGVTIVIDWYWEMHPQPSHPRWKPRQHW